jgi:CRP-like cAMP-binding protein
MLAEHTFFKDLKPEHIQLLAGCAMNVRFDEGAFIFRANNPADQFYIIRHGQVALEIHDIRRGPIRIETLGENDVLGWSWLFPPYRWHFDARAVSLTRAIALNAVCLREKCEKDHELGYDFLKRFATIIVDRLQATRMQVLNVYG